ncbi:hypothetical protein [Streptomyces sp. NPDC051567]|uniref:hypothetical protein n=1 Tax=Streptomyces sp. NPDC051567 TaxID=3365660 RepID=UPI003797BB8D
MNVHHLTRLVSAVIIAAVLIVGAVLDWPNWLWFLLPTLGAGAFLADMVVPRSGGAHARHAAEPDEAAPEPPAELPYQETYVVVVPVESTVADCPFLFSATVSWRLVEGSTASTHGNPAALAATSVLQRVRRMTSAEHPSRCAFLERELEGFLGAPMPDYAGLVSAFATDIRLVLRQRDQEHLEELDGLRKAMDTWESRRQHERSLREYLGEDVLQSPGSAVVWWMARHDDQIERAVEMIAPLTVLSAAANDEEIPEAYRDLFRARESMAGEEPSGGFDHPEPIGEEAPPPSWPGQGRAGHQPPIDTLSVLLDEMGLAEGTTERAVFLYRLAGISDAAGRPEAAENIRMNLRGAGQDGGHTSAGSFEDSGEEPPPTAGSGYPPPSDTGHRSDRVQPPRTGGWQVTPEGLVSEAGEPTWPGPGGAVQDGPGRDREGGEW